MHAGLRRVLLVIAAVVGAVSLAATVAGALFDTRFSVVATGSMWPALPEGALSVSVPVTADQLRIGDVVTVSRPGMTLPVTHRIVAIETVAGVENSRELTLRGDNNLANDSGTYSVTTAHRVVGVIPWIGGFLWTLRSTPIWTAFATVALAALVLWASWPARRPAAHRELPARERLTAAS